jgi:NDP-sugar pyrophosphorylase family protein
MRAILIATGFRKEMNPLMRYHPTPLLKIVDKPIIFYIIEFLTRAGVRQFDVILYHLPAAIEEKLQEGKRWGISLTYHLAKDAEYALASVLPALDSWSNESVILGPADCLPAFSFESFSEAGKNFYSWMMYPSGIWSGWGLVESDSLRKIAKYTPMDKLPSVIKSPEQIVRKFLSTQTFQDLKSSNMTMLTYTDSLHLFPSSAQKVEKGIWISRAVSLHPNAILKAPIFIGEQCQIKAGVQLGPNVVIESNCIIDQCSQITNSVICQKSYIGENLEIHDSLVNRNLLINLTYDTLIHLEDDFILSGLSQLPLIHYPFRFLARFFALLLFILLFPIFLYLKITSSLKKIPMIRLPAQENPRRWRSFNWLLFAPKKGKKFNAFQNYFTHLPLLLNIIRGDVHFVGVVPRSIEDIHKMPFDWQKLYLKSKVGIVTLSALEHEPFPTDDDLYAAETYYSIHTSLRFDLTLMARWIKKKFISLFKKRTS